MSTRWLPAETSPVELTITHDALLRTAWLERLASNPAGEEFELDLCDVLKIDSADVRMPLSLRASLAACGVVEPGARPRALHAAPASRPTRRSSSAGCA